MDDAVNHQVKTLIHELAHALMHLTDPDGPELSYADEEVVVESIAFNVVGGVGIDTSGYSIPYLASWSTRSASKTPSAIHLTQRRQASTLKPPPGPARTSPVDGWRAPVRRAHQPGRGLAIGMRRIR